MNAQRLIDTARTLVASDKGLLAMDESNPTCNKRFAKLGIPQTAEARRAYRELIVTTPGLGKCISGAILYDETIRQQKKDGTPFVKVITAAGIIPGIKVDTGAKDLAGHPQEKMTEGLDGLRERLVSCLRSLFIKSACGAGGRKWPTAKAVGKKGRRYDFRSHGSGDIITKDRAGFLCRHCRGSRADVRYTVPRLRRGPHYCAADAALYDAEAVKLTLVGLTPWVAFFRSFGARLSGHETR
jgi:hypothetical protein